MPESLWQPKSLAQLQQALLEDRAFLEFPEGGHFVLQNLQDSPCRSACPAGVDVKGYVGLIAQGRFQEALDLVRRACPLPGVCGRICTHPCELACQRSELDDAVAVRLLKRFIADWELAHGARGIPRAERRRAENVAVIGSGPAGLAAALDLARLGYGVTVFEAEASPGGMLAQVIPGYRLPRDILAAEIAAIAGAGVEFRTGVRIGQDLSLEDLRGQGFAAVVIAVGMPLGRHLEVQGEKDYAGVYDCVSFLRREHTAPRDHRGEKLLVIGGGMSAMDAARTGVRLGFDSVQVVYRRTRDEMPAIEVDVVEAVAEGVELVFLAGPRRILGEDGRVTGLECDRMKLVAADESGRPRPVPIRGSDFTLPADVIVEAISQRSDLSFLPRALDFEVGAWSNLVTDPVTMATRVPWAFACGDVVTGPDTVVGAMAQGHVAARSVHAFLRGQPLTRPALAPPLEAQVRNRLPRKQARVPASSLDPAERGGFDEVERGYDVAAAMVEAARCMRCGPCEDCLVCASDCRHRHVMLAAPGTGPGAAAEPFEPVLIRVPADREEFPLQDAPRRVTLRWQPRGGRAAKGAARDAAPGELGLELTPLVCAVEEPLCRGCGDCLLACPYEAIRLEERGEGRPLVAVVQTERCRGCGTCVTACPTQAMHPGWFSHRGVLEQIDKLLAGAADLKAEDGSHEPRLLLISCNWCFPMSEALAATLPAGTRSLRLLCTGRVHPSFVTRAFEAGADGVFVAGCAKGECHYGGGNERLLATAASLRGALNLIGLAPERFEARLFPTGSAEAVVAAVQDFEAGLRRAGALRLATAAILPLEVSL
ncbi:MAG: FAD-dependent oxidoreductase [Candidatus Krumholzibacteriota bacterium]|nr:FAD-dependent oxidoreductase [Candidatus Krumholzibacteriota bacterium]